MRRIANTLTLRVLCFVLLGFGAVAAPAYVAFDWIVNSTVVQLGTLFAEKQVLYDRHRGLGTLIREVSLADTLSSSQAIRDWARNENDPELRQRGLAELEHYRRSFADGSYFFVIDSSGNYYFNDAANAYAGDQLRYAVKADNPRDAWYFATKSLGEGCHLNVDNDANLRVTKVWMNCVIREGRQVLGVLGTGIDLTAFIQEVVNIPQNGVTTMFVDRQGLVQAHRDENLVNLASLSAEMRSKYTVFHLLESEADKQVVRQMMDDLVTSDGLARSAFVTIDGKKTLLGVGYLDQLGWYNVTLMDIDTIIDRRLFGPIGALLAVMMGLVAVVLMLVFKRQVLDRIEGLEHAVHQAGVGNYTPATSLAADGNDEIGRLSTAFADMARTVDSHTRELEARVRERTLELEQLAFRDGQTGLLNRRGFAAAHAKVAHRADYGLLLVDIDHFKSINDTHGHASGDVVVAEVSRRIREALDGQGAAGRWGGDEFIVLLPESSPNLLRAMAYAVMAAISAEPVRSTEGQIIDVSVSVGACLAEAGDRMETATEMADTALYMAKARGRNKVVVFEADMHKAPKRLGN